MVTFLKVVCCFTICQLVAYSGLLQSEMNTAKNKSLHSKSEISEFISVCVVI